MNEIEIIKWAVQQGGGWVVAIMIFLFYRKDALRKQDNLKEAHERRDKHEDRLMDLLEKTARSSESLTLVIGTLNKTVEEHHRFTMLAVERIGDVLLKIQKDATSVLERLDAKLE